MPVFQYKALKGDGGVAEGEIEAGGRQEAFRQMEGLGLRPIRLAERNGNGAPKSAPKKQQPKASSTEPAPKSAPAPLQISFGASERITPRMLENFTRLLSSLLAAGVPLSRALVILVKEATAPAAKAKWKQVHDHVVDGLALAEAMGRAPETFPKVYVAMVEAG